MQRRASVEMFELFFTPRFPLFFIPGALLVAVMGNALSDLLKSYLGDMPGRLWIIFSLATVTLIALVSFAILFGALKARLMTRHEYRVLDKPNPAKRKGFIAFVSLKQRAHLEKAISYHQDTLERIWLIATKDANPLAEALKRGYETDRLSITIESLDDEWDLLSAKQVVEQIYRDQLGGLAEQDVIADFTGGTKPMTVGMIFACLSPSRTLEYVPATYGDAGPKPLEPIEYVFDARTIGILGDEKNANTDNDMTE